MHHTTRTYHGIIVVELAAMKEGGSDQVRPPGRGDRARVVVVAVVMVVVRSVG